MGLDICCHGAKVGSDAVYEFIERHQPLMTVHGHIHESSEYNGGKWYEKQGKTLCMQGGQIGFDLHYAVLDIENGKITNRKHSIYYG